MVGASYACDCGCRAFRLGCDASTAAPPPVPPFLGGFHQRKHHPHFQIFFVIIMSNPFLDGSMSRPPLAWSAVALAPSATITSACICSYPPLIIVASSRRIGIHLPTVPLDNTATLTRTSHTHYCCVVRDSYRTLISILNTSQELYRYPVHFSKQPAVSICLLMCLLFLVLRFAAGERGWQWRP